MEHSRSMYFPFDLAGWSNKRFITKTKKIININTYGLTQRDTTIIIHKKARDFHPSSHTM